MTVEPRPIRLSPVGKFIAVALIVALAILLISAVGPVMTPFVAAVITAYLFNPLIGWLNRRTRIGRAVWIGVLYILIGVLAYALIRTLGPIIGAQYKDLVAHIPSMAHDITKMLHANQVITIAGLDLDIGSIEQPVREFITELGKARLEGVPHLFVSALETLLLFLTYLIVTFYFLLQAEQITNAVYGLVPAPYRAEIRSLGRQIDGILSGYIRGTLLLIPIMATLTYIALTILGVRYALVLAIATGILETIPLIGPWSAAGIAVIVSLLQPTTPFGWSHAVLAAVVGLTYFTLRMSEDNFIIPHVVGHAVHLHPVLVLFAILAGGALGGAFGLLVGIPVVAIVQLLLRYLYRKLVDAPEPPPDIKEPPPVSQTLTKPAKSPPLVARTLRKRRS
jgi:predicted PurR-regulated permease PerM